ncbi:PTS sugar transporter subunit IIC [Thermoactinomyces sp. CICC 10521]|uniref:PTS sugar transporter subunit IIC n=1 Tax=Thermoactinomyces sp. CICC 10521 TaxID=2767426 RepID=UPI0018DC9E98|nr:PTS sugar transporter subunit IIC [Thermoactinomyces sp. CICC 10521]MBH8609311.1 PTS sugar transporter subunit IIC [Thermoactinomyces sp. CICC 10521]
METFLQWIDSKLMPPLARLSEVRHLRAIRDGIISALPLILVGAFFLIIANPPIPGLAKMVEPYTNDILIPFRLTLGLMALYASFGMGYSLARSYKLDGISGGMLTMATFIMATIPVNLDDKLPKDQPLGWLLPMENLGGSGLFMSILAMLIAVESLRFFKKHRITLKMPDSVPSSVSRSFEALIPAAFIIVVMWVIRVWLGIDLNEVLHAIFKPLAAFAGNSYLGALVPVIFIMLLWSAGIHGDAVVGTVFQPIWFALLDQNAAAAAAGKALPNLIVEPFFQWFVWIGGSGTSIGLAILMCFSKSSYLKKVGRFSIVPGIFNINEPIVFGVPMVMNPLMFIPFVLVPIFCTTTTYIAFSLDLINRVATIPPWTLPAPIGAYLATGGDWRAIVLCLVNICLSVLIYYPFFKVFEKRMLKEEKGELAQSAS